MQRGRWKDCGSSRYVKAHPRDGASKARAHDARHGLYYQWRFLGLSGVKLAEIGIRDIDGPTDVFVYCHGFRREGWKHNI
jgi:hypothetical protein